MSDMRGWAVKWRVTWMDELPPSEFRGKPGMTVRVPGRNDGRNVILNFIRHPEPRSKACSGPRSGAESRSLHSGRLLESLSTGTAGHDVRSLVEKNELRINSSARLLSRYTERMFQRP